MNFNDEDRRKAAEFLSRQEAEAAKIAENPDATRNALEKATAWFGKFATSFNPTAFRDFGTILRMVGASLAGEYSGLSKTTLVCFLGALMYCVSPLDAIPDALPVIGLLDDIFVVGWTAQRFLKEIRRFRGWERAKEANATLAPHRAGLGRAKRVVLRPGWMTENADPSELIGVLRPIFPLAKIEYSRWRSNVSWDDAREYADGAGAREFAEYLSESPDCEETVVIGHSLGARTTVRALATLSRSGGPRVAQAFLMGAAISADAPELDDAVLGTRAPLCNFYSRSDRVLNYLYNVAEGEALGAVGAARPLPNFIDCVVSGSGEYWLDVADNAATFLSFLQSRTSWSKLVFAENAANGAREFFRHQFTQYARFFRDSVCDLDANVFLGDGEA